MMCDAWRERLSEYVDGDLDRAERHRIEEHLEACAACSATSAQLAAVKARAGALEDREPAADLWPGILERLAPVRHGPDAVDLGERRAARFRRYSFSLPQLAAAGIALVALTAATVWMSARPPAGAGSPAGQAVAATSQDPASVPVLQQFEVAGYDVAVAELERALEEGRDALDPVTVRALESSLAVIDQAIREAREALAGDPANRYLSSHLAATMKRKVELLKRAAAIARSASS